MPRKKNSAAKQMHATQDHWEQYYISIWGPRYTELKSEIELLTSLLHADESGQLEEWVASEGVAFFRGLLDEAKRSKPAMLRRLVEASEMKQAAEPWRCFMVTHYKIPVASETPDGPSLFPIRDPDTIPVIQQELFNRFGIEIEDRKLRQELKALGVPFAPSKRGRPPTKKLRRKS